jgi:carbon storage regulator
MLVLSRRKDEKIIITVPPSDKPTTVEVVLVDIRGNKSRIGINAPRQVAVNRDEVQEAIKEASKNL